MPYCFNIVQCCCVPKLNRLAENAWRGAWYLNTFSCLQIAEMHQFFFFFLTINFFLLLTNSKKKLLLTTNTTTLALVAYSNIFGCLNWRPLSGDFTQFSSYFAHFASRLLYFFYCPLKLFFFFLYCWCIWFYCLIIITSFHVHWERTLVNVLTVDCLVSQFYWSNLASWHLPEHTKDVLLIFLTVLHYLHVTWIPANKRERRTLAAVWWNMSFDSKDVLLLIWISPLCGVHLFSKNTAGRLLALTFFSTVTTLPI